MPNAPLDMVSSEGYVSCGGDANLLIERWFGDCVYTSWDTIAFFIGISSVCFWIVAQLPQFISNFLRKSADALSPWFLAQWLAVNFLLFLIYGISCQLFPVMHLLHLMTFVSFHSVVPFHANCSSSFIGFYSSMIQSIWATLSVICIHIIY